MKNAMSTVFLMTGKKILNGIHKTALHCAVFNDWHHYRDRQTITRYLQIGRRRRVTISQDQARNNMWKMSEKTQYEGKHILTD